MYQKERVSSHDQRPEQPEVPACRAGFPDQAKMFISAIVAHIAPESGKQDSKSN